ncbi:hypothetical protein ABMA28_004343 [Loxostege sticticalis]|uniref:CHK kinase-like domain-containing protein n=1 Tax=Loxostege sticticalis TaxID=481309 RepID=A0ABD0SQU6_LOXSC
MQVEEKSECKSVKPDDCCNENAGKMGPELKSIIDTIAKNEGFTTYNLSVKNITADGNNYLGLLTEVTVQDTLTNKELNLFVKSIIANADQLQSISVSEVYGIEIYFYLELSKILEELQADAQIPIEERYTTVKCYKESTTEHIVMDNMIKRGFCTWNRFDVISLGFAETAIKQLAKFHSLGFVLQEKRPQYFKEKIMPMRFPWRFNENFQKFFENSAENVLDYLEDDAKSKLKKNITALFEKGQNCTNDRESTLTMCHGDYRPNNILIKTLEGKITGMVPVDYQLIHHGSPLSDLLYFIFGATDREFRRKHLEYLKNLYYDTMKQFLKYFDMDVQTYHPKEEFERLFKERLDYGLFHSIWYLQINLTQKEDVADMSNTQLTDITFGKSKLALSRIQETVDEFIEWGYL